MKKPRDLAEYTAAADAIARLRGLADHLEARGRPGDTIKWTCTVRFWNDQWSKWPDHKTQRIVVKVGEKFAG